ncbi:hypothetical protein [Bacillus thuringiensis]|uniref:hypothetical protein n=1 Tax=Bacillus thuringiensis TaxID=1428 RepID=UPI000B447624|nr:hypothetical protein [Bacillus thuringiensis]MED3183856.1 hypothetical protein [Bacillus thuringiensis]OTY00841.1 hypothetical protein BK734_28615 [Bacillus thuringiensis serovar kim]OUB23007.1 hypothetical protein BK733_00415 [Bacillus thuringiensis serovar xiaguangiensis]
MGTTLAIVLPNLVSADTITPSVNNSQKEVKSGSILDWKEQIFYALEVVGENKAVKIPGADVYNWTEPMGKEYGYYDVVYHQFSVEAGDSPIITN